MVLYWLYTALSTFTNTFIFFWSSQMSLDLELHLWLLNVDLTEDRFTSELPWAWEAKASPAQGVVLTPHFCVWCHFFLSFFSVSINSDEIRSEEESNGIKLSSTLVTVNHFIQYLYIIFVCKSWVMNTMFLQFNESSGLSCEKLYLTNCWMPKLIGHNTIFSAILNLR